MDHRVEPKRLIEINTIKEYLEDVFKNDHCQIWTGDFNALTKEDYSQDSWQTITEVRKRNGWELPKVDLTDTVKQFGFKDTWYLAGCPEPVKTCRFDTHIDYVYANSKLLNHFSVDQVVHVDDSASDHNMVVTTFKNTIL